METKINPNTGEKKTTYHTIPKENGDIDKKHFEGGKIELEVCVACYLSQKKAFIENSTFNMPKHGVAFDVTKLAIVKEGHATNLHKLPKEAKVKFCCDAHDQRYVAIDLPFFRYPQFLMKLYTYAL